ncbi:MAG: hypothetical protein ACOYA8_08360 [Clostridium sp.]|jgi:hypothetical protein
MTRKKNKLMAFLWSLLPGAGEMYLGFYKQGISLMSAFFILLGTAGFLHLGFFAYLTPIIWFYSFFHTNNINGLSDEEFYTLEDDYLIHWSTILHNRTLLQRHRKLTAVCLLVFGVGLLWNLLSDLIFSVPAPALAFSEAAMDTLYYVMRAVPQIAVAILIIAAGLFLIRGKYEDLNQEDKIPSLPEPDHLEMP